MRIPHALAFDRAVAEVDVERRGDTLVVRPLKPSTAKLVETLRQLTADAPRRKRPEIDWPTLQ